MSDNANDYFINESFDKELGNKIPDNIKEIIINKGFKDLRPSQIKSIKAGLFDNKSLLVCTPTASGKTLVGELGIINAIINHRGKAVYVVPLRALANEKYKHFKKEYPDLRIGIATGDKDRKEDRLENNDLIIMTSEKLDSVIRHRTSWLNNVRVVVIDEIHLLNDITRGPTLEVIITILKKTIKPQIIGLSATIGNPEELADWLGAELVIDYWRPVKLYKGIMVDDEIEFE